jgi:hypothetical protein
MQLWKKINYLSPELDDNDTTWTKLHEYVIFYYGNFQTSVLHEFEPITVAFRSKVRNVVALSNNGIADSNHTGGMAVCLRFFYVCVVLCR